MAVIVLSALFLSLIIYIYVGYYYKKSVTKLGDIIPLTKGTTAMVANATEFSASTVATTISLATVVVAFFELVPALGLWLLWPVVTTSLGLFAFGLIVKKIWTKLSEYDHRPSLHEFLGTEFNSKNVALIGATFTTLGYLSAFAVELTVGSRFLASLIPDIPEWITVIIISIVAFIYTGMGGFRTVVVTDRIQMYSIWILLFGLIGYYMLFSIGHGGIAASVMTIPEPLRTIKWNTSLIAFVSGIFIMNLFTYVSNMGLWQRVAGSQNPETVVKGMRGSVISSAISWGLFVVIAVGAFMIITPKENENILITLLNKIINDPAGKIVVFLSVLGLYGAMLSTASTQLIAVSHTIYEDIIAPFRKISLSDRLLSSKELRLSRIILVSSALIAVGVVELMRLAGFSVADMAFAIYGAALCLVPAILFALYSSRKKLAQLKVWANVSLAAGFISAWTSAVLGKALSNGDLVFWAPCISIAVSSLILFIGWGLIRINSVTATASL
jgi:Na+/proline symporter